MFIETHFSLPKKLNMTKGFFGREEGKKREGDN